MPNDAKLGLVIGVGVVVAVAILFFHKDLVSGRAPDDRPPANVVTPPGAPSDPGSAPRRSLAARPTSRVTPTASLRRHTVVDGDTLYGLAERYYGDGERFIDLYQSNRDVLKRPDRLEVGTVLVIPDLPESPDAP
jgi:nucleoid-associated protein YgaU